jgi:hypothetical protein
VLEAVETATLWKRWKIKNNFPAVSTALGKVSAHAPTFPQLRLRLINYVSATDFLAEVGKNVSLITQPDISLAIKSGH